MSTLKVDWVMETRVKRLLSSPSVAKPDHQRSPVSRALRLPPTDSSKPEPATRVVDGTAHNGDRSSEAEVQERGADQIVRKAALGAQSTSRLLVLAPRIRSCELCFVPSGPGRVYAALGVSFNLRQQRRFCCNGRRLL